MISSPFVLLCVFLMLLVQAPAAAQRPELVTQTGHSSWGHKVIFSRDGRVLASSSIDSTIKLWDVSTGTELRNIAGHHDVETFAFSPDSRVIASGGGILDKTIKLWDVDTGAKLLDFPTNAGGVDSIAFSPDGKVLASCSPDETIMLWDVATGDRLDTGRGVAVARSRAAIA